MGPYINITYKFLINCIKKRNETKIIDDISCIINADETLIFFENPTKDMVDIKGKKIDIITFGKDKMRFTAVLSISASGQKLPPLIISKRKSGKRKEDKLHKFDVVKEKKFLLNASQMHGVQQICLNIGK